MIHGGPPCPHDLMAIVAAIQAIPFAGYYIGAALHKFIDCCKKCCGISHTHGDNSGNKD